MKHCFRPSFILRRLDDVLHKDRCPPERLKACCNLIISCINGRIESQFVGDELAFSSARWISQTAGRELQAHSPADLGSEHQCGDYLAHPSFGENYHKATLPCFP